MHGDSSRLLAHEHTKAGIYQHEQPVQLSAMGICSERARLLVTLRVEDGNTFDGVATWAAGAGGLIAEEHHSGLEVRGQDCPGFICM